MYNVPLPFILSRTKDSCCCRREQRSSEDYHHDRPPALGAQVPQHHSELKKIYIYIKYRLSLQLCNGDDLLLKIVLIGPYNMTALAKSFFLFFFK